MKNHYSISLKNVDGQIVHLHFNAVRTQIERVYFALSWLLPWSNIAEISLYLHFKKDFLEVYNTKGSKFYSRLALKDYAG